MNFVLQDALILAKCIHLLTSGTVFTLSKF